MNNNWVTIFLFLVIVGLIIFLVVQNNTTKIVVVPSYRHTSGYWRRFWPRRFWPRRYLR